MVVVVVLLVWILDSWRCRKGIPHMKDHNHGVGIPVSQSLSKPKEMMIAILIVVVMMMMVMMMAVFIGVFQHDNVVRVTHRLVVGPDHGKDTERRIFPIIVGGGKMNHGGWILGGQGIRQQVRIQLLLFSLVVAAGFRRYSFGCRRCR